MYKRGGLEKKWTIGCAKFHPIYAFIHMRCILSSDYYEFHLTLVKMFNDILMGKQKVKLYV